MTRTRAGNRVQTHTTVPDGSMQAGDLVPIPPLEPMFLSTENGSVPYEDFVYDVARASDPGFHALSRTTPETDGEGYIWTYHWHPDGGVDDPEQLQATYRQLTPTANGGMEVLVTNTELQIGIDTTGWNAGDIMYFDGTSVTNIDTSAWNDGDVLIWNGTSIVNYSANDSGGTTNAYPVTSPEPVRILRGDVNDDGTAGHGNLYGGDTLWTSANTGTGLFSVSFGYAFPEVPSVTLAVAFNVPSQRSRVISFTSPPATGGFAVAIQEFNETTQQFDYIDVAFHFQVIGLNGNY